MRDPILKENSEHIAHLRNNTQGYFYPPKTQTYTYTQIILTYRNEFYIRFCYITYFNLLSASKTLCVSYYTVNLKQNLSALYWQTVYNINALYVALEMCLCPLTEMKHARTDLLL